MDRRAALRYSYGTSHGADQTYGGLDPNSCVMPGAFGYPYPAASRGDIHIANLSYDLPGEHQLPPGADMILYAIHAKI